MTKTKFILYGQPITKKNSMMRTNWGGVIQSKAYREYAKNCREQIDQNYCQYKQIKSDLILVATYYMRTKRLPDLLNLLQATCDIISDQKRKGVIIWQGIIKDDKQIIGFDNSRIVGKDKNNPRVEIELVKAGAQDEKENN